MCSWCLVSCICHGNDHVEHFIYLTLFLQFWSLLSVGIHLGGNIAKILDEWIKSSLRYYCLCLLGYSLLKLILLEESYDFYVLVERKTPQ